VRACVCACVYVMTVAIVYATDNNNEAEDPAAHKARVRMR